MWFAIARWLFKGLLREYGWQIVATLLIGVVSLVLTVVWALSSMAQPAGIYWLASQAPPEMQAQHPLVPVPLPAPFSPDPGQLSVVGAPIPQSIPPHAGGQQWADGPAYNQFSRAWWRSSDNFATWAPAACSTASLAWMLRAYGRPVQFLDDALALENPPFGITYQRGLSDHTGTQLAVALAHQGFSGFKKHFTSTAELVAGLRDGPLMMDGFLWFGVGHWFVAIGSDAGGIAVRESSGNNITYLTWQQLYGPVGWSGWAVGVLP